MSSLLRGLICCSLQQHACLREALDESSELSCHASYRDREKTTHARTHTQAENAFLRWAGKIVKRWEKNACEDLEPSNRRRDTHTQQKRQRQESSLPSPYPHQLCPLLHSHLPVTSCQPMRLPSLIWFRELSAACHHHHLRHQPCVEKNHFCSAGELEKHKHTENPQSKTPSWI